MNPTLSSNLVVTLQRTNTSNSTNCLKWKKRVGSISLKNLKMWRSTHLQGLPKKVKTQTLLDHTNLHDHELRPGHRLLHGHLLTLPTSVHPLNVEIPFSPASLFAVAFATKRCIHIWRCVCKQVSERNGPFACSQEHHDKIMNQAL
mmetsp:Transcript_28255/g.52781  ORF Transcript_28255/g.52781 Transcript_28255/m.52781 type:complete len:146 (-) Transcript_28255:179-616(-)